MNILVVLIVILLISLSQFLFQAFDSDVTLQVLHLLINYSEVLKTLLFQCKMEAALKEVFNVHRTVVRGMLNKKFKNRDDINFME